MAKDTSPRARGRGGTQAPIRGLPHPTQRFRRRAWLEFQRALDPLAPPKPLPPDAITALQTPSGSVPSRPSSSMLSNRPGEIFEPVTAMRIG